jgi:hypothetical protein
MAHVSDLAGPRLEQIVPPRVPPLGFIPVPANQIPLEADNAGKLLENRPETPSILQNHAERIVKSPRYQTATNRTRRPDPPPPSYRAERLIRA